MSQPILIMGATSGIGAKAVEEAVSRGLPVRGFARGADNLSGHDGVEPFAGDALSLEDVTRALDGVKAVVYALGIKERLAMLWEEETLFSESTKVLLEAMAAKSVKRVVVVTGFGAGRSRSAMSSLESFGHKMFLGRPYADMDRQEELIVASDLDWTIARPVILTNNVKSGKISILAEPSTWKNGLISRADVANYLIDAVEQSLNIRDDVVLRR